MGNALKIIIISGVCHFTAYYVLSRLTPFRRQLRQYMIASVAIVAAAVLSRSILIGYVVTFLLCYRYTRGADPGERIALFFGLAFTMSYFDGFALNFGLNLGGLSHPKVLMIAILLPLFLFAKPEPGMRRLHAIDKAVIGFLLWTVVLGLREANVSSIMRSVLWTGIQYLVPYLVIRRYTNNYALVFAALSFALFSQAMVGTVEAVLRWHIHTEIEWLANFSGRVEAMYKYRWGFLRAQASFMNPLIFNLFANMSFLCAVILFLRIGMDEKQPFSRLMSLAAIALSILGTLSTVSRAGMLGSVLIIVVLVALMWAIRKPRDPKMKLVALGLIGVSLVVVLFSDEIRANFAYRVRLLELGSQVIMAHPVFGQATPTADPMLAELIQGEGIVDLVNQYISIGLHYGLPGLGLFIYALIVGLNRLYDSLRKCAGDQLTIGVFAFSSLLILAFNLVTSSAFAWTWHWIFILMALSSNVVARVDLESRPAKPRPGVRAREVEIDDGLDDRGNAHAGAGSGSGVQRR